MKTIEEMSTEELMQLSEEDQAKAFLQGIDIPDGENKDGESPDLDSKNSEELENPEESNDSEEKVILAKDGKNTIPFSELEAAREREKAADLRVKQLEDALLVRDSLIADLQAAKKIDDKIGGHEEQKKVLDEYQGEFPELVEDIKPFLENMIRKGIEDGVKSALTDLEKEIAPFKEQSAKAELDNKNAWLKAQDDFLSANQVFKSSPILYDMLDSAVKTVAADDASNNFTYQEILDKAKEMVQAATGKLHGVETPKKPDIADVKKKAEDIIARVEEKTPFSLSDVPGSTAAHHDEAEALANMSALATMDKFMSKSPDKIEELLSRLV